MLLVLLKQASRETIVLSTGMEHFPPRYVIYYYNRQVTHNSYLYENQDFNILKITNLTFETDI
jgi:hypothetical protein